MSPELMAGILQFGAMGILGLVLNGGIAQMNQITKALIDQNARLIEIIAQQDIHIQTLQETQAK